MTNKQAYLLGKLEGVLETDIQKGLLKEVMTNGGETPPPPKQGEPLDLRPLMQDIIEDLRELYSYIIKDRAIVKELQKPTQTILISNFEAFFKQGKKA